MSSPSSTRASGAQRRHRRYRSFVASIRPRTKAWWCCGNTFLDNDDLGRHILESRYPLSAVHEYKEVPVDAAVLERYVGEYELTPAFKIAVTREASRLFAQATGQPRFEIFPHADRSSFSRPWMPRYIPEGRSDSHQNGMDQKAKKVK